MPEELTFRTPDHPAANGRTPTAGEVCYPLSFTTENGTLVRIELGQAGFDSVTQILLDLLTNAPPYDDGSLRSTSRDILAENIQLRAKLERCTGLLRESQTYIDRHWCERRDAEL